MGRLPEHHELIETDPKGLSFTNVFSKNHLNTLVEDLNVRSQFFPLIKRVNSDVQISSEFFRCQKFP